MVKFNISGEFIVGYDFQRMVEKLKQECNNRSTEFVEIKSDIGGKLSAEFINEDLDTIIKNDNNNNKNQ